MRVVHVGFHLDRAERSPGALLDDWPALTGLASALAHRRVDVTVVQPAHENATLDRGEVRYRFVAERAALLRRGTPGSRPVRAPGASTIEAVAEAAPDVVHVHGLSLPAHARRVKSRLPGTPLLAQDHADRPPPPWRRFIARRAMQAYDAVAFTAAGQASPFRQAGLFPTDLPVWEVPEASTDFSPGDRQAARAAISVHGDPCLAWVGRLDANKDPLTIIDGLASAMGDLQDPHLWCCWGDGPLLPALRQRIEDDHRLRDRVHLLGTLPHPTVQTLLRAADGMVLGSRREGSGFAVIEAMACGATPLVPDIPPFRALCGDVGVYWQAGDPSAFARALNRAQRERFDPARRAVVRSHFEANLSWDAVARRLLDAYRALRGSAPAGTAP